MTYKTQLSSFWRELQGHVRFKFLIRESCKKRADNLLKYSRHILSLTDVTLTRHAPDRVHLFIMGQSDRELACRFCRKEIETKQHIVCSFEALP
jgi:hypothetical protein